MATWMIIRGSGPDGTEVFYINHITDMKYHLGSLSSDVPDNDIVAWVFAEAGPAYGDKIRLSDGSLLVYQANHARASA